MISQSNSDWLGSVSSANNRLQVNTWPLSEIHSPILPSPSNDTCCKLMNSQYFIRKNILETSLFHGHPALNPIYSIGAILNQHALHVGLVQIQRKVIPHYRNDKSCPAFS